MARTYPLRTLLAIAIPLGASCVICILFLMIVLIRFKCGAPRKKQHVEPAQAKSHSSIKEGSVSVRSSVKHEAVLSRLNPPRSLDVAQSSAAEGNRHSDSERSNDDGCDGGKDVSSTTNADDHGYIQNDKQGDKPESNVPSTAAIAAATAATTGLLGFQGKNALGVNALQQKTNETNSEARGGAKLQAPFSEGDGLQALGKAPRQSIRNVYSRNQIRAAENHNFAKLSKLAKHPNEFAMQPPPKSPLRKARSRTPSQQHSLDHHSSTPPKPTTEPASMALTEPTSFSTSLDTPIDSSEGYTFTNYAGSTHETPPFPFRRRDSRYSPGSPFSRTPLKASTDPLSPRRSIVSNSPTEGILQLAPSISKLKRSSDWDRQSVQRPYHALTPQAKDQQHQEQQGQHQEQQVQQGLQAQQQQQQQQHQQQSYQQPLLPPVAPPNFPSSPPQAPQQPGAFSVKPSSYANLPSERILHSLHLTGQMNSGNEYKPQVKKGHSTIASFSGSLVGLAGNEKGTTKSRHCDESEDLESEQDHMSSLSNCRTPSDKLDQSQLLGQSQRDDTSSSNGTPRKHQPMPLPEPIEDWAHSLEEDPEHVYRRQGSDETKYPERPGGVLKQRRRSFKSSRSSNSSYSRKSSLTSSLVFSLARRDDYPPPTEPSRQEDIKAITTSNTTNLTRLKSTASNTIRNIADLKEPASPRSPGYQPGQRINLDQPATKPSKDSRLYVQANHSKKRLSVIAYGQKINAEADIESEQRKQQIPRAKLMNKPLPSTPYLLEKGVIADLRGAKFMVVLSYSPQLSDELTLRRGDIVEVFQVFDDGWCLARVLSSAASSDHQRYQRGVCPKACLAGFEETTTATTQIIA